MQGMLQLLRLQNIFLGRKITSSWFRWLASAANHCTEFSNQKLLQDFVFSRFQFNSKYILQMFYFPAVKTFEFF